MLEFLKPPDRTVVVLGRRAVRINPEETYEPKPKTPAEWEALAKPIRRKFLWWKIGYWSCVVIVLGMIAAGLKLWG